MLLLISLTVTICHRLLLFPFAEMELLRLTDLHRVTLLANGLNCDLLPKPLSLSPHHAAFGVQSLETWGSPWLSVNLVQPLLGSCFQKRCQIFVVVVQWNPSPLLCSCSLSLSPPHLLFAFPTFSPWEFQGKWNPYVFDSFALNSSKYDFERE